MVTIRYIESSGVEHTLDIAPGLSVMQGAVENNVRGILADCGGACSCATCHVYVDANWVDKVGPKSEFEEMLLEEVLEPQENSRLACQIKVNPELDGLIIRMPQKQV